MFLNIIGTVYHYVFSVIITEMQCSCRCFRETRTFECKNKTWYITNKSSNVTTGGVKKKCPKKSGHSVESVDTMYQ